ncbi:MAG: hypothetical protein IJT59_04770 [Desulfovibrionaceae bacterium]|nr:hypothetical protein [Desulfovibrionaceae bacterium]
MHKLLTVLTPFAPDQSGAVAALFQLGGIIIICDAGGCTGNICGFDEPRWREKKSAIFSLGLRDIDAILGRDDRLIDKTGNLIEIFKPNFLALIGTPVPTVIGTDYAGLAKIAEKKFNIPVINVPCTGTRYYDVGVEEAWTALLEKFFPENSTTPKSTPKTHIAGVLGATPLDLGVTEYNEIILENIAGYTDIRPIGFTNFDDFLAIPSFTHNFVISNSGLKLAKLCQEKFGTPYTINFPLYKLIKNFPFLLDEASFVKRILIIHEQILADTLRTMILSVNRKAIVTVGTFFKQAMENHKTNDKKFDSEQALRDFLHKQKFDLIIADVALKRVHPSIKCCWIDLPHFAVSGRLLSDAEEFY